MKALFIGGALHDSVREVKSIGPDFRYRRTAGDHVYESRSFAQTSTGKRWLIYVRKGALPASDVVAAMITQHALPTIEEQRNEQ